MLRQVRVGGKRLVAEGAAERLDFLVDAVHVDAHIEKPPERLVALWARGLGLAGLGRGARAGLGGFGRAGRRGGLVVAGSGGAALFVLRHVGGEGGGICIPGKY